MGVTQIYRGNPETKQVYITSGFVGGMNVTMADDLVPTNTMRNLVNIDCDVQGELSSRKGFGFNNALTEALYDAGLYPNTDVNLAAQKEVYFSLLRNDNSSWQRLADSESLAKFIETYGSTNKIRYLRLLVDSTTKTMIWEDVTLTLSSPIVNDTYGGEMDNAVFMDNDFMTNWEAVDKYGKIYFTNNDKGMLIFDSEAAINTFPWKFVGSFSEVTNSAYKPNGIEARKIGFNVLGTSPLGWLDTQNILTESIQGVYLTTTDRKPVQVIPSGSEFQVNIMYTGTADDFTIVLTEDGSALEITVTENVTYSTTGLKVYDIALKTQPTAEVEFMITYTDTGISIEPYYDYYYAGQVPADAKAIEQLNIGDYKMVEIYDRVVYYKGNIMWFSEIARYDYIPNYNFILLPIDSTDAIVRILFFRTSYIIFTKRRIYKISGDFESTSLTLDLVNANIGCISPRTPMVIGNSMFFVSTQGLRALKTDTFKENLENISEFDEAIAPLITGTEVMQAFYYKDQYFLMNNLKGKIKTVDINYRTYKIPDNLRYYYRLGAFVSDNYGENSYPRFLFMENGLVYTFRGDGVYRMGDGYLDFDEPYDSIIETAGIAFGYPSHEKKVKSVILKAGGNSSEQPIQVDVAADGSLVSSTSMIPVSELDGVITYQEQNPDIPSSEMLTTLYGEGVYRYHTKKMRLTARGKNIAIRITASSSDRLTIQSIGYIFKLSKIKE